MTPAPSRLSGTASSPPEATDEATGSTSLARRLSDDLNLERMAEWLRPLASPMRLRLLRYLTTPHYLEEVASHLKITRQAARKHLDKLVGIGVLQRQSGVRETGPVTEYVINPQSLFLLYNEFEKLGSLRREEPSELLHRTITSPGRRGPTESVRGPCLFVVRGLNVGQRLVLTPSGRNLWLVGRDQRCDLAVSHDPYASNRHAELRWENGHYVLSDLSSTNGTQHNWNPVPRGGTVVLQHGDLIAVGKTLLLFWGKQPSAVS